MRSLDFSQAVQEQHPPRCVSGGPARESGDRWSCFQRTSWTVRRGSRGSCGRTSRSRSAACVRRWRRRRTTAEAAENEGTTNQISDLRSSSMASLLPTFCCVLIWAQPCRLVGAFFRDPFLLSSGCCLFSVSCSVTSLLLVAATLGVALCANCDFVLVIYLTSSSSWPLRNLRTFL